MPKENSTINERLQKLTDEIFANSNYISEIKSKNKLNFMIFTYDPKDEVLVDYYARNLKANFTEVVNPVVYNLYDVFISICRDLDILDSVTDYETSEGSRSLLNVIYKTVSVDDFVNKMSYSPHNDSDVVVIYGVGDVFPFLRLHVLLESMHTNFSDVPVLIFYPGEFSGYQLKLFNKLTPSDYYRAVKFID